MNESEIDAGVDTIEWRDPAPLRAHMLHGCLPEPQLDSPEWHAFVDGLSGLGPEGTPAIHVTPQGWIMDGVRRWLAAKQLQWQKIACIVRPEWEAPLWIVESLFGQRCLTKGAKVYLSLQVLKEYASAAEMQRLTWLEKGVKILRKPLIVPLPSSGRSRHDRTAAAGLAERFGVSEKTVERAIQIRKLFESPALREHKFQFQDGEERTLREHFEPLILDAEHPMGLGDVIKGIGWFVGPDGQPLDQAPPERNSHLFYWERQWGSWAKGCQRWEKLSAGERAKAIEAVREAAEAVPGELLEQVTEAFRAEVKKRGRRVEAKG